MTANNSPLTALITGASAGIGEALAREFASHGHALILVARRAEKLEALAKQLQQEHSVQCHCIPADLTADNAAQKLFDAVEKQGLSVDILVNNAGLLCEGRFDRSDFSRQMNMLQLNIKTLTALCHLFMQPMMRRGSGRLLNVASTSAFQPVPTLATYAASKAYVLSFTEALAAELQDSGVTATALCPGFTDTDMIAKDGGAHLSLPGVKNMTPAQVAAQGYEAVMDGKVVYVNGLGNRLAVGLGRLQPSPLRRWTNNLLAKQGF